MRAPAEKRGRRATPPQLAARLREPVALEADATGKIVAHYWDFSVNLGIFSSAAVLRAQDLRVGLPLRAFATGGSVVDKEILLLVQRLARHGLLEYRLEDLIIIEPQCADYWPGLATLDAADVLVLSRFAYMRRRGDRIVLESPRAGALFKICDPKIATIIASLSTPQSIKQLRQQDGFPGLEFLALLFDCQILLAIEAADASSLQPVEGDDDLVLWDFHDFLFHTRSTQGRHANPVGGTYAHVGSIDPQPAVRPRWPGKKIDLKKSAEAQARVLSPFAQLLRERHSIRAFDDARPITLAELSHFLDVTARILSTSKAKLDYDDPDSPMLTYTVRPYPSAGAAYELELYLAVNRCEGLARGYYHYDADKHVLVSIATPTQDFAQAFEASLMNAQFAMGAQAVPQILLTIAARFGRMSWKYSSISYALIQKNVGVLLQTLYLAATDMGLGGCAIGTVNIDLFAKMTGIEIHVEGPVGQFALGRRSSS